MAIMNVSEFEAVLGKVLVKIDKFLYERGEVASIKEARRTIEAVSLLARDPGKLKAARPRLEAAGDVLQREIARDDGLRDDLWDCLDFVDFHV